MDLTYSGVVPTVYKVTTILWVGRELACVKSWANVPDQAHLQGRGSRKYRGRSRWDVRDAYSHARLETYDDAFQVRETVWHPGDGAADVSTKSSAELAGAGTERQRENSGVLLGGALPGGYALGHATGAEMRAGSEH